MAFKSLGRVVAFAILALVALAQPSPPAEGIQLGNPSIGWDVRFPLTITQCEPVFIYHNNSYTLLGGVGFVTPDGEYFLFVGPFPLGAGYFEWVCNIPANTALVVFSDIYYPVVVQLGQSISSCLGAMTTTNIRASYVTSVFTTFTASRPITTSTTYFISPTELATYFRFFHSCCPPDTYPCQIDRTFPNRGLHNGHRQVCKSLAMSRSF